MGILLLKLGGRCIPMSVLNRVTTFQPSRAKEYSKTCLRPSRGYGDFHFFRHYIKYLWKEVCSLLLCVYKNRHLNASSFRGSIVVESAFAFPIFFFCLFFLMQIFSMLQMELMVAEAGIQAARKCAALGYLKKNMQSETKENTDETQVWDLLKDYGSSWLEDITFSAFAEGKLNDTAAKRAGVYSEVDITCEIENETGKAELSYVIQPMIPLLQLQEKEICVYVVYRLWSGVGISLLSEGDTQKGEETGVLVYMTEQGKVYHMDRMCTYLTPKIQSLSYRLITEKRNSSGGKYYACDFCVKKNRCEAEQIVYITQYGNRFHISAICSAIKRNVHTLSEEEAAKVYPVCKKCGGNK